MTPIRLVAFDLYGTLLDVGALVAVLRPLTPMPEALVQAWRARQLQLSNAILTSARYVDFDRITLTALHDVAPSFYLRLDAATTKRLIDAWAQLPAFEDVRPALDMLVRRRVPITVVTNAVASTARNALRHAGIDDSIVHLFSCDTVKAYKPKAAAYEQVLALGVAPAEVLFVSGNDWDVGGARQVGFHTIFVNRHRATLMPKAERTLVDLHELDAELANYALSVL